MDTKALRILLTEDEIAPNAKDGLDRIVAIAAPLLEGNPGDQITTSEFIANIREKLGWNLNADIASVMLNRMHGGGIVDRERVDERYIYFYKDTRKPKKSKLVKTLCNEFRNFCSENPSVSDDKNQLISELSTTDDDILNFISRVIYDLGKFFDPESEDLSAAFAPDSEKWERTLVAEFILGIREDETLSVFLDRISEVILISEVVENYRNVENKDEKTSLLVLLDTRPALSLIGVSGRELEENAQFAFEGAKKFGCKLAILPSTVAEMRRVLTSMLSNTGWDRYGATATAIRRGEVAESFVRDVANNPEKHLAAKGVVKLPRSIDNFPNEHHFFPKEKHANLLASANWNENLQAIEHDAEAFTIALRMRKGSHSHSLFRNSVVVVSQNTSFVRKTTSFALEKFTHTFDDCPVVISQSNFATQVWLKSGVAGDFSIPRSQLFSACEQVSSAHRGVFKKVQGLLAKVGSPDYDRFEIMLQDRRCLDILTRKTLNDVEVVDETNVKELLGAMKASLLEEERRAHDLALVDARKKHDEEVSRLKAESAREVGELSREVTEESSRRRDLEQRMMEIQEDSVKSLRSRDDAIEFRRSKVNADILTFRNNVYSIVAAIVMLFCGYIVSFINLYVALVFLLLLSIGYVFGFYYRGPFGRLRDRVERWYAVRRARREFSEHEFRELNLVLSSTYSWELGDR